MDYYRKKVYIAIKFSLRIWLQLYIGINTELRKYTKNDSEKNNQAI